MTDPVQSNRAHWDELVPIHARSPFYDLAGFKAGKSSLHSVELAELGDVAGQSLLHLQCHFGLDTLSWARLGARVTGVDFSPAAVELASALSTELGIPARFVCANIYDLPQALRDTFDIVFTSYGVLCWLPDLERWAQVVAHFLRPGGTFYIVEFHPLSWIFDESPDANDLRVVYPYFHSPQPLEWAAAGSYADPQARLEHRTTYEWAHSLGDIVNGLIGAGLEIEFLHEFPYTAYAAFPFLEEGADGWWRLPAQFPAIPLMFSIRARRRLLP